MISNIRSVPSEATRQFVATSRSRSAGRDPFDSVLIEPVAAGDIASMQVVSTVAAHRHVGPVMNPILSERRAARWFAGAASALFLAIFVMHAIAQ